MAHSAASDRLGPLDTLFLYIEKRLKEIVAQFPEATATIEPISRDFFVTLARNRRPS